MSFEAMDPDLLQDFLTESGELIEQLDNDLVALESAAGDEATELLNGIFRALHTIKGAASFLALNEVTTFAHAAEDALNKLRKGEAEVTQQVMDALLRSTDVVRQQIDELNAGDVPTAGPDDLVAILHAIAEGAQPGDAAATTATDTVAAPESSGVADSRGSSDGATAADAANTDSRTDGAPQSRPLDLPSQKVDLIPFMADDLRDASGQLIQIVADLRGVESREEAADQLSQVGDALEKTTDFFELDDLTQIVHQLQPAADALGKLDGGDYDDLVARIDAVRWLIDQQAGAIDRQEELIWPTETFRARLGQLAKGESLGDGVAGQQNADGEQVLAFDGVIEAPAAKNEVSAPSQSPSSTETNAPATPPTAPANPSPLMAADDANKANNATIVNRSTESTASSPASAVAEKSAAPKEARKTVTEQTIRVEVSRLESLLNLVGQLLLNKNRFLALTRRLGEMQLPQDLQEEMTTAAGDYDRVTGELQMGVMRTRMQPLAKLFDRYPRVIRDIARMTDKQIELKIEGRETEVDKSVLELLADPLVHVLRNSADHGVEMPADRKAAGKLEKGTITLSAEHQGSHVRVAIMDDGKGLDREVIGSLAVERGLCTAEQLTALPDEDVFRFIFAAGFSTAKKVSDLSGRGVGMDVVRTNVNKMNGTINIHSKVGEGTTIEILIPLTVAIMPAMMVGVGSHLYAVPLQAVSEIVRPDSESVYSIQGKPVMRLRDEVLPLVNLQDQLDESDMEDGGRFTIVIGAGGQRAGLIVDRLVGQQEIVIKPLDDEYTRGGPFSGATIRENGEVSLILDVLDLLKRSHRDERVAA